MSLKRAIDKINRRGILLVFPIKNSAEPPSLWSELYPGQEMRWEWTDDGDDKVARMWRMMKRLSECRSVVYSKWYQGRATFFSRRVFTAMLCLVQHKGEARHGLSAAAAKILEALEIDSPLSTKQLKEACDLQGRLNEPTYNRAMKELFTRLLIVAYGEVEDGSFPSLAVGATRTLFEDLWLDAKGMRLEEALEVLNQAMPTGSPYQRFFAKSLMRLNQGEEYDSGLSHPGRI